MAAQTSSSTDGEDMIFILAGQSNMAGRGEIFDEEKSHTTLPVWLLVGQGEQTRWTRASEPLHREADGADMRAVSGSPAKAPRELDAYLNTRTDTQRTMHHTRYMYHMHGMHPCHTHLFI
jgi:hypothetical protein